MIEGDAPLSTQRKILSPGDIAAMERTPRAMLINSLPGYKPGMLVGTCDGAGQTNLAIVSSHFHLGSDPPLLAMILRPSTGQSERHTLINVLGNQSWTLNSFTLEEAAMAHQTSASYGRNESEFVACDFAIEWVNGVGAPFVETAALQIGCELREHHPLSINGTNLLIGEVTHLSFPSDAQRDNSSLDLSRMGAITVSGLDTYSEPSPGERFAAADPHLAPRHL